MRAVRRRCDGSVALGFEIIAHLVELSGGNWVVSSDDPDQGVIHILGLL
jgi:hypothetical protein